MELAYATVIATPFNEQTDAGCSELNDAGGADDYLEHPKSEQRMCLVFYLANYGRECCWVIFQVACIQALLVIVIFWTAL